MRARPNRRVWGRTFVPALVVVLGVLFVLFGGRSGPGVRPVVAAPASTGPLAADGVIVQYKSSADLGSASAGLAGQSGGKEIGRIAALRISLVDTAGADTGKVVSALKSDPRVAAVQRNATRSASFIPNDGGYTQQWAPGRMNLPAAWDITQGSSSVTIAIIDTGVWAGHPDLQGRLVPGYDFVNDDADPDDDHGHGTHVAGIAAANGNNGFGVAGVAWNSKIMPLKILDRNGDGFDADLIAAVIYATDHGAKVINMSLGGTCNDPDNPTDPFPVLRAGMEYALSRGVLIAAASGNSAGSVDCPAAYAGMTAVASSNSSDGISGFSNFGPQVAVAAPGSSIFSTLAVGICDLCTPDQNDPYGYLSGTSMATPQVAGLAALILAANPTLTNVQVRTLIQATADDLGTPGRDDRFGAGRINAGAAVAAATGSSGGGGATPTSTCAGARACGSSGSTATATATATSISTVTPSPTPPTTGGSCGRGCGPVTSPTVTPTSTTVAATPTVTVTATATVPCARSGCGGAPATATTSPTTTPTVTPSATATPRSCGRC